MAALGMLFFFSGAPVIQLFILKKRRFISVACLIVEMIKMTFSLKRKVLKFDNNQIQ